MFLIIHSFWTPAGQSLSSLDAKFATMQINLLLANLNSEASEIRSCNPFVFWWLTCGVLSWLDWFEASVLNKCMFEKHNCHKCTHDSNVLEKVELSACFLEVVTTCKANCHIFCVSDEKLSILWRAQQTQSCFCPCLRRRKVRTCSMRSAQLLHPNSFWLDVVVGLEGDIRNCLGTPVLLPSLFSVTSLWAECCCAALDHWRISNRNTFNTRSNLLASVSHMLQLCVCVSQKHGFSDGEVRVIDSCRAPCSQSCCSCLIGFVQWPLLSLPQRAPAHGPGVLSACCSINNGRT